MKTTHTNVHNFLNTAVGVIQVVPCDEPLVGCFGFILVGANGAGREITCKLQRQVFPKVMYTVDQMPVEFLDDALKKHWANNHHMERYDEPVTRHVGYVCLTCKVHCRMLVSGFKEAGESARRDFEVFDQQVAKTWKETGTGENVDTDGGPSFL